MTHDCPGCGGTLNPRLTMCEGCFRRLPGQLRAILARTRLSGVSRQKFENANRACLAWLRNHPAEVAA